MGSNQQWEMWVGIWILTTALTERSRTTIFPICTKGLSRRVDGNGPPSSADLRQQYQTARSERERRDVALQAIDEGVIQTFGRVNISTVDAIFGTHLASQLPTNKEDKRTGIVDFASSPTTSAGSGKDGARTSDGWFMAVEYYSNGNIANYYLTNVRK